MEGGENGPFCCDPVPDNPEMLAGGNGSRGDHGYLKRSSLWVPLSFLSFPCLPHLPKALSYPPQEDQSLPVIKIFTPGTAQAWTREPQFRKLCVSYRGLQSKGASSCLGLKRGLRLRERDFRKGVVFSLKYLPEFP